MRKYIRPDPLPRAMLGPMHKAAVSQTANAYRIAVTVRGKRKPRLVTVVIIRKRGK